MGNTDEKPIVVIGAGIVGVSTAIWLQREGLDVVLIDKTGPAAGTSHGNGGVLAACAVVPVNATGLMKTAPRMLFDRESPLFVRWSYLPRMLPWLFRYISRANPTHTEQTARALNHITSDSVDQHLSLAKGTPAEKWVVPSDYIFVYEDRAHYGKDKAAWALRKKLGYKWEEMDAERFEEYEPVFKGSGKFAVRLENHGYITDPGAYVKNLADHFVANGGRLEIAEVIDFETKGGKITGIKTSEGEFECSRLILAAGIWSQKLGRKLGVDPSMESERGYHIELINPSVTLRSPLMLASGKFVVTSMKGRLRCAGIVELGGLEAKPSQAPFELLLKLIHEAIPDLKYDRVVQWMGHRPAPSDSIPSIGPFRQLEGAYGAYGHHHIGLTAGPKTGRMIADMITGKKSNIDLKPYDVSRFT